MEEFAAQQIVPIATSVATIKGKNVIA